MPEDQEPLAGLSEIGQAKLRELLTRSLEVLHPDDRADVMQHPGLTTHLQPDGCIEFRGAQGRVKVTVVDSPVLFDDAAELPPPVIAREFPDTAAELFDDNGETGDDPTGP